MITIKSNASSVMASIVAKVRQLGNTDQLLRNIANDLLPEVKTRIHTKGLAADGNEIGTYSPSYMKLRTKGYKSDAVTRGKNKGQPRTIKKFNRTNDTKVVSSLTRQQEKDFSVIPSGRGYGLGFKNEVNAEKAEHVEATYNKPIWKLTAEERAKALASAEDYKNRILNGQGG